MHNSMPAEALLHGKCLAAAGVLTHERAPLLVEREDVALEVEHGGVGAAAAFPGAPTRVPLRGVNSHMLLQEILALKRLLAHVTCYVLFMGFSHMFQKLCPCFCHKRTFFLTHIALVDLPVSLQTAGRGKVFSTSFMGTLERRFVGVLALMDFQLLMLLKGLLTTFKTAYILFLLVFMFAFKMFLQVCFCVEFLITATSCTNKGLFSSVNQGVAAEVPVPDEGLAAPVMVTNKRSLPRVLAQVRV